MPLAESPPCERPRLVSSSNRQSLVWAPLAADMIFSVRPQMRLGIYGCRIQKFWRRLVQGERAL